MWPTEETVKGGEQSKYKRKSRIRRRQSLTCKDETTKIAKLETLNKQKQGLVCYARNSSDCEGTVNHFQNPPCISLIFLILHIPIPIPIPSPPSSSLTQWCTDFSTSFKPQPISSLTSRSRSPQVFSVILPPPFCDFINFSFRIVP